MKAIGIVRKIDQLGRIVLPKSLRKRYQLNVGDPVEIFIDGETVVLEKFRPKCVFCGSAEAVREFRNRNVCSQCITELKSPRIADSDKSLA